MNRQLLDSQGPITGMTPTQALTAIQTMADYSQKWHDGTSSRNVSSSSNTEGLVAIICASVNVMPMNTFAYLRLANLNTNMLVEMADMTKKGTLRKNITGMGLSFPGYILAKYEKYQNNSLVWGDRYVEWCNISPTPGTSSQESNELRPINYTFNEWTLIKKKGHMIDKIWEYCKDVHRDNTYWWHEHGFEKEECDEMEIEVEKYDPLDVQVETFKVRKYSFKNGQKFVCVTKEEDDTLPLERRNRSRFKEMIRKEFDKNTHDKT
ncbi:hypothetical protein Tco_0363297 [Tanacetum coccineum]